MPIRFPKRQCARCRQWSRNFKTVECNGGYNIVCPKCGKVTIFMDILIDITERNRCKVRKFEYGKKGDE